MDLLYAIALHRLLKVGFFVQSEVEMGSIQGIYIIYTSAVSYGWF